jgi:hypothetical protein
MFLSGRGAGEVTSYVTQIRNIADFNSNHPSQRRHYGGPMQTPSQFLHAFEQDVLSRASKSWGKKFPKRNLNQMVAPSGFVLAVADAGFPMFPAAAAATGRVPATAATTATGLGRATATSLELEKTEHNSKIRLVRARARGFGLYDICYA